MPRSPKTYAFPHPRDPRVMMLARALKASRAAAFTATCDAWMALAAEADDAGLVAGWTVELIDACLEADMLPAGAGQAMSDAGLVIVREDGLVLPADIRPRADDRARVQADTVAIVERDIAAHVVAEGAGNKSPRRLEQEALAARRYRRRQKAAAPKLKQAPAQWRSLGRAAGHEIRVYEGQYGVYAMVLGATLDGKPCKTLTAGDKSWSLESVRLVDVLPGLAEKAEKLTLPRNLADEKTLCPSVADLEEAAARERAKAAIMEAQAADQGARHDDASSRHHCHDDASSSVIIPSSSTPAENEAKSNPDKQIPRHHPSSFGHDDAVSSMSCLSKSSSSIEEEDVGKRGREAGGGDDAAEPEGIREWDTKRKQARVVADRIGEALGLEAASVIRLARNSPDWLSLQCRSRGVDPRTGLRIDAGAAIAPHGARGDIDKVTRPPAGATPPRSPLEAAGVPVPDLRHDRPVIVRPPPDAGPEDPPDHRGDALADHADDQGDVPAGLEARAAS